MQSQFAEAVSNILSIALLTLPLLAVLITVPAALLLLHRYRRAVLQLMMTPAMRSKVGEVDPACPPPAPGAEQAASQAALSEWPDAVSVPLEVVNSQTQLTLRPAAQKLLDRLMGLPGRSTRAYWMAGIASALITAALFIGLDRQSRALYETMPGAVFADMVTAVLMLLWPAALTHPLIAGSYGRFSRVAVPLVFLGAATLAIATLYSTVRRADAGEMSTGLALFVATLIMFSPTVPLLICSGRSLRAVGPVALCAVTMGMLGLPIAGILLAIAHYQILGGPWVGALIRLVSPVAVSTAVIVAVVLLGLAVRLYNRKTISDHILLVDAHYIALSVWLALILLLEIETPGDLVMLLLVVMPVLIYRLVLKIGLAPLRSAALQERPLRLLLLRVFGAQQRSEELFEELAHHWRYAGSMQLIAGSDLAAMTVEPHEIFDFLSGSLKERFVSSAADLETKWSRRDLAPDPDGRFRVNEFFCHDDTWQDVLVRLLSDSDVVLMDLRGFCPQRQGCVFELHQLVDFVAMGRIILLVDHTTDVGFLSRVLNTAWYEMEPDSPNQQEFRDNTPDVPLRMLRLPAHTTKQDTHQLIRLLADAATQPEIHAVAAPTPLSVREPVAA